MKINQSAESSPVISIRALPLLLACLVPPLVAVTAPAETTIHVGGAGTIGDTILITSGGTAKLPDTGDTWKANGGNGNTFSYLDSPSMTVSNSGEVTLTFTHRYNFEDGWDGGAVYLNVNGGGFFQVANASFSTNGYIGTTAASVWTGGEEVFTGQSTNWSSPELITSVANLGTLAAGDNIQVEFRGGWDGNTFPAAPNWEIGAVRVADTGVTLLNRDFAAHGPSGFATSTDGTGSSPWTYLTPLIKFEINGDTLAADRYKPDIAGSVIDLNSARIQVALLTGTLDVGDTFSLFDLSGGTTLSGSMANIGLPGGVAWDTGSLATAGTITVTAITAADGTWIVDGGGNWSDTNNWLDGIVADFTDRTASFTVNITAARAVTNDTSRTIGTIIFTDSTTSSHDLTLFGTGGNTLTLDVTTNKPVVDVTQLNRQLTINCVLSGTNGYQKNGPGVLNAVGANTYTGTTVANGGILNFGSADMNGFGGGAASRDIIVSPSASVQRTWSVLNNAFLGRLVETNHEFGVFFTATGGSYNTNDLDFSSGGLGANLPNAFLGVWAGNGAKSQYDGIITPPGDNYRLGFTGQNGSLHIRKAHGDVGGTPRGLIVGGGAVILGADNTFSGDTVLRAGRLFLGRQLCLQNSALNVGTGSDGINGQICFLLAGGGGLPEVENTDQPTLGGLIGSRNLATIYNSANQNNTARLAATAVVGLTLDVASNKTCVYGGNVRIATGMYLTKNGEGTQILAGVNTYAGATSVSNGTLLVNSPGSLDAASAVTVEDGGVLGGDGTVGGSVTLNSGSTLQPGNPTGTLIIGGDLTVNAGTTNRFALGTISASAAVTGNLVLDGVLKVADAGGLANGEYTLFTYGGSLTDNGIAVINPLPGNTTGTIDTGTPGQVKLVVTGGGGLPPVASFAASAVSGVEPLQVVFTDTSTGSPTAWGWSFGDGNTSTLQNPTNVYAAGSYTVSLVASNANGASIPCTTNISVITVQQSWTNFYGVAASGTDSDGDGVSNADEFNSCFNPTNAGAYPHIMSVVRTGGNVHVTFLGSNGDTSYPGGPASRANILEYATGTANGGYTNDFASTGLTNVLSGGNGSGVVTNFVELGGATNGPARYYRLRVQAP